MVNYKFKIIIIGSGAVGKTSLLYRFVNNEFLLRYKQTIGVDFMTKDVEYESNKVAKITIWDIGGQDRYKFLRESFFDKTDGALLVFDVTRKNTSDEIKNWCSELRQYAGERVPFIVIGNKMDLLDDITDDCDRKIVESFALKEGGDYIETSAKTGSNVETAFMQLTKKMIID